MPPRSLQRQRLSGITSHRHLNHRRLTRAAIDDVISRRRWNDWAELRRAALSRRVILDNLERGDPKILDQRCRQWHDVRVACARLSRVIFERACEITKNDS